MPERGVTDRRFPPGGPRESHLLMRPGGKALSGLRVTRYG